MELRELRYFMALAEERHFGRAAKRLYITQSGLSKAIQGAELELGVALFTRTRRHVELTPAGVALSERAPEVLRAFARVSNAAAAARAGLVGTFSLATSPIGRYEVMPPLLQRFRSACPNVRLIRREQLSGGVVEDLLAGDLDAGIAFCAPLREGLEYELLKEMPLRALLSSSHPLAGRDAVELAELRNEPILVSSEMLASGSLDRLKPFFAKAGFKPKYTQDTVDYDEDLYGVRRGKGVVLSARTFLAEPPAGVTAVRIEPSIPLPLDIVRRSEPPSAILALFIALARQSHFHERPTYASSQEKHFRSNVS